jgi:predicted hotdog family 3-hydroxylacyl-ACP dehydratase
MVDEADGVSAPFPAVESLLPQAGPMRLLERVLDHDETAGTRCLVHPGRAALFADARGRIPAWVALEWMAQCAAAYGGLVARARGEAARPGLFVGSRRLRFRGGDYAADEPVEVTAQPVAGGGERFAFACAVRDARHPAPRAEGRLHVLVPRDLSALLGEEAP